MRRQGEQNHAQLALPLQRERRVRAPIIPFVCEDELTGRRWYGIGREPQWVKAFKARHFMYPIKTARDYDAEIAKLTDYVTQLLETVTEHIELTVSLQERVRALEDGAGMRRAA